MSIRDKLFSKQFVTKGVKFAFIGAVGTVLNLGILYGLTTYAHVYYILSELIAIIIVFAFNYIGNIVVGNIKIESETRTGGSGPTGRDPPRTN
jgi:hypothetical protein